MRSCVWHRNLKILNDKVEVGIILKIKCTNFRQQTVYRIVKYTCVDHLLDHAQTGNILNCNPAANRSTLKLVWNKVADNGV